MSNIKTYDIGGGLELIEAPDLASLAIQINEAAGKAIAHVGTAIEFARQAGELLLAVKNDLPHGEFIPWVESNIDVTPRQAQRYMSVAQGKPMPIRKLTSKATPMSYLPGESSVVNPFIGNFAKAMLQFKSDMQEIEKEYGLAIFQISEIALSKPELAMLREVQLDLLRIENALHRSIAKSHKAQTSEVTA